MEPLKNDGIQGNEELPRAERGEESGSASSELFRKIELYEAVQRRGSNEVDEVVRIFQRFPKVKIHPSWQNVLDEEFEKKYFEELTKFVKKEFATTKIYPEGKNIFRAFELCPFESVKVVILGQDPYHGPGQANGLCFSVSDNIAIPPSLQNIYKEIESDLHVQMVKKGNLDNWAKQGILLLNATLTVQANKPGSHQQKGWEKFTDAVINVISEKKEHVVFLLWGKYAQEKGKIINLSKHLVLTAAHPSPFSAHSGFFGCRHFSKTNEYLEKPIDWTLL